MSEEKPPQKVEQKLTLSPYERAQAKIKRIKTYVADFSGKPGCNPHLWLAKYLTPLENDLKTETKRNDDLYNKINALPDKPDVSFLPDGKEGTPPVREKKATKKLIEDESSVIDRPIGQPLKGSQLEDN